MAIDTSFYGRINPLAIQSPFELAGQAAQIQGAQQQNRLAQMQLQQAERNNAQQEAISNAYQTNIDPTTGQINRTGLIGSLASSGQGAAIPSVQKSFAESDKATREAEKAQYESVIQKTELVARGLSAAKQNPALYPQIVAQLKEQIPGGGADLPEQYDPAIVDSVISRAMSIKDQADQAFKERGYDLDVRRQNEVERNNRTQNNIAQGNLGVAQGNLNVRRQELVNAQGQGKAPPGYRFTKEGNLEAIPGGPADIKAGELGAKREKQVQASVAQADRVISTVDSALKKAGNFTAGFGGSTLANIPGTPARDLASQLETIKANLGFAELQAMRDASPTGGALGAIAVQELIALQSTVASLDQGQSPEQLRNNLQKIRTHYNNWKKTLQGESTTQRNPPNGGWSITPVGQ